VSDHLNNENDRERERTITKLRAETIKKIGTQLREVMRPPDEMSPELASLVAKLKE
jgi:hypothetical protein